MLHRIIQKSKPRNNMEGEYPHIRHKLSSVNLRNNLQGHSNSLKRGIRRMDSKYSQLEESKDIPKHSRERNVSIYSDYEDDEIQMEFDNLITILSTHFAKENIYQVFSLNDVVRLHFHEISNSIAFSNF